MLATVVVCVMLAGSVTTSCASRAPSRSPAAAAFDPAIRGGNSGLEIRWWLTGDTDGRVGEVLAPYTANATPLSSTLAERWNLNGFRMVRVPAAELTILQQKLPPIAAIQSIWLGWAREWTEAMRGRRVRTDHAVLVNGEPRSLPAGSLRFIARAWGAAAESGPVLRVELAAQLHEQSKLNAQADPFAAPVMILAEQEGEVFRGLTLSAALEPGFVYVITAEKPGTLWGRGENSPDPALPRDETMNAGGKPNDLPSASLPAPPAPPVFGPEVAGPITLGQAMLAATPTDTGNAPARAVVVLVPRIPGQAEPRRP